MKKVFRRLYRAFRLAQQYDQFAADLIQICSKHTLQVDLGNVHLDEDELAWPSLVAFTPRTITGPRHKLP